MELRRRTKLAGAILSTVCVALCFYFVNHPVQTGVSLELNSSANGYVQLYYDSGHGFDEAHSVKVEVKASPPGTFRNLRFSFRTRRLRALRLNPKTVPGRFVLRHVWVHVEGRQVFPTDIVPSRDLSNCAVNANSVACDEAIDDSDPQFYLHLPYPLNRFRLHAEAYRCRVAAFVGVLFSMGVGVVLVTSDSAVGWIRRWLQWLSTYDSPQLRFVALTATAFVLLALRRPDALTNPQLWAEDGLVFLGENLRLGFWHTLFTPYSGYLHVIPRLIAGLSDIVPMRVVPLSFSLAAITIEALSCSAFLLPWCRRYIQSDRIRAAVCLITACVIPSGHELLGTISNVQWWLVIPGFILMVWMPENVSRWKLWASGIVCMLIALSAALMVIAVPLVVACYLLQKRWPPGPVATILVGAVIQVVVALGNVSPDAGRTAGLLNTIKATVAAWLSRPVLETLCGETFVRSASDGKLTAYMIAALCVTLVGSMWLFTHLERSRALYTAGALYVAGTALALAFVGRSLVSSFLTVQAWRDFLGQRYFFFPSVIFVLLVGVAVDRVCGERTVLGMLVLAALFGTGIYRNFRAPTFMDLQWPVYAAKIERWKKAKSTGQPVDHFAVPINPPPWLLRFE